jgi:acetate kinase
MRQDLLVTLNAGSSSIKFGIFAVAGGTVQRAASGQVEGLLTRAVLQARKAGDEPPRTVALQPEGASTHVRAMAAILDWIAAEFPGAHVVAAGHRIVHGGPSHAAPALIDDRLLADLRRLVPLAPLHQPHNLAGVEAARDAFPGTPQVACFDTAFHRGHAFEVDAFAIPRSFYDDGVRRYGFHGLSYEYVSRKLRDVAPIDAVGAVVIAHLGNGASLCAVKDGVSVASTMGFTALDGLVMGTRCGQIDPGVLLYLMSEKGMDAAGLTRLLYTESGLKGLSGLSADMRELLASDSVQALEAVACFVSRICREVASLAAVMQGIDAIVFTGGIGENAAAIRAAVLRRLAWLGVVLDDEANAERRPLISAAASSIRAFVVPTDEEHMIAEHTARVAGVCEAARAA